jgi:phenylpropionate dioxygenase-like ring-hydroxylating dioxygenase large terminal subunit
MSKSHKFNIHTQRQREHKVFNNWNVLTNGWYQVCRSKDIKINTVKSFEIDKQKICVFRKSDGSLAAMDGYCPHMGVDLGIGTVVNDRVRCFFHHWEYGEQGKCEHIPVEKKGNSSICLNTYSVNEKYGFIWINPDKTEVDGVLNVPEYEGCEISFIHGKKYFRSCHYHITMINGIDPQHLKTVHSIHMEMDVNIEQTNPRVIDIELNGKIPANSIIEKFFKALFGDNYSYSMKYADGCVAALSVMKNVKFFGFKNLLPTLNMIFAYKPAGEGKTEVQPIFVTRKRKGPLGFVVSKFWLTLTKITFYLLQGEDGKVYENIRFSTENLLEIDRPVMKYVRYINQLKPSMWSKDYEG